MRHLGRRNVYLGAGLRIAPHTGLPLGNSESPEADKTALFPFLKIVGDIFEEAVQSVGRLTLANLGILGNHGNHFFFGHKTSLIGLKFVVLITAIINRNIIFSFPVNIKKGWRREKAIFLRFGR